MIILCFVKNCLLSTNLQILFITLREIVKEKIGVFPGFLPKAHIRS
jgi:hypothetical protein